MSGTVPVRVNSLASLEELAALLDSGFEAGP
jgi:hypothetical protein